MGRWNAGERRRIEWMEDEKKVRRKTKRKKRRKERRKGESKER